MSMRTELGWFVSGRGWWGDPFRSAPVWDSYDGEGQSLPRVILLSSGSGQVEGVAAGSRSGRSDSFSKKIRFDDWAEFSAFNINVMLEGLTGPAKSAALNTASAELGRFTSIATTHILSRLRDMRFGAAEDIQRMLDAHLPADWLAADDSDAAATYREQLDGLRMGLAIAGLDRDVAFESIEHPSEPENIQLAPLLEDQIVVNDVWSFSDWQGIPAVVSGVEFWDPSTGQTLRTFLANKLPLELQTGADVIYYSRDYHSFVLVQYKRCRDEGGVLRYRPDTQLDKELKRMRALQGLVEPLGAQHLKAHRVGPGFCFIKLCEPRQPVDSEMSRGRYFDLDGFGLSIERGPQGGRRISYQQTSRYMTNSLFADLVSQGWVGSAGDVSEAVLAVMEVALDNDRSVLLAEFAHGSRRGRSGPGSKNVRVRRPAGSA